MKLSTTNVVALLAEAYVRAATIGISENSIKAPGIWRVNRDLYEGAASGALKKKSEDNAAPTPTHDNIVPTPTVS